MSKAARPQLMAPLKIVIAGPKQTGKTLIGNFLAGQSESLVSDKYTPTVGVRILEFEARVHGVSEDLNVEIWDASGDHT